MLFNDPFITAYVLFIAAILGLVTGSFVNCWAWRYLAGESIVSGRSHCVSCGHELSARDLVPVFSWLFAKGRCRYCGAKVSVRYPLTELICAAAFVGIVAVYGLSLETAELIFFASVLLFLSLTDLDELIIPNGCILVALVVRLSYMAAAFALGSMNIGDVLYFVGSAFGMGLCLLLVVLVADLLFKRSSMGGGDLKLFFVAGLYFGWQQGLFLIVVSCIVGIVVSLITAALTKPDASDSEAQRESVMKQQIPFGPSIALSCLITMLVGKPFLTWYLSLMFF